MDAAEPQPPKPNPGPIVFEDCPAPPDARPCPDCGRPPAAMKAAHRWGETRWGLYCATSNCLPPRAVWADSPQEAVMRWNAGERDLISLKLGAGKE